MMLCIIFKDKPSMSSQCKTMTDISVILQLADHNICFFHNIFYIKMSCKTYIQKKTQWESLLSIQKELKITLLPTIPSN